MSTSGSYDFSLTAGQIVQAAFEDLGVVLPGGPVAAAHSTMALSRLNMLVKQWQGHADLAPGLKIHTRQRVNLFLAKGQQIYRVGPALTDARSTIQYGRTTLSASKAAGQTTLSITSNVDTTTYPGTTVTMTVADIIGIYLDDGTILWSTISNVPGATVAIPDPLPSAASTGNYVWWFTARAQRFPIAESAVLRTESYTDSPLAIYKEVAQYELGVANKYAHGTPGSILIEPLRLNTRITLDSQPTDIRKTIVLTVLYPAENYDALTNDIAFPQEWFAALSWELAFRLSASVGRWTQEMKDNRESAITMARSLNPEMSVAYFQPNA